MRVAIVNDVWSAAAPTAGATLDRFTTLTGWAEAVQDAGAESVAVFQRFADAAEIARGGVTYHFLSDGGAPRPPTWFGGASTLGRALAAWRPDIVHVNGVDYPRRIRRIRLAVSARCAVVLQDHGGFEPARLSIVRRAWIRRGMAAADALLVAAPAQVTLFRESGLVLPTTAIHDVMEGSTTLSVPPRARERTAPPALLWVGRLNDNKDPLTVLRGFAAITERHPDATLTMVYGAADLESEVRAAIDRIAGLRARVTMVGEVRHEDLAAVYAASDVFVLGSHAEGSGYAALEALACGVIPVVTDIASFRAMTDDGRVGALWRVGDAGSLRDALERVLSQPLDVQSREAMALFEQRFSWAAIGRRAVEIYRGISRT